MANCEYCSKAVEVVAGHIARHYSRDGSRVIVCLGSDLPVCNSCG